MGWPCECLVMRFVQRQERNEVKQEIVDEIKRLDPKLSPDDESYKAAAFLLASIIVGPTVKAVKQATGYREPVVQKFADSAIANGIWKGRRVIGEWDDKETGGLAFWCDVLTITGMFQRARKIPQSRKVSAAK